MAKLFLGTNDSITVFDPVNIFGATGNEVVKVSENANVIIDQGVERVEFSKASASYTFQLTGNILSVKSEGQEVANIAVQGDGTKLAFTDGSADLTLTGLSNGSLGGGTINGTESTLSGTTLDAFDKSDVAILTVGGSKTVNVAATGLDSVGGDSAENAGDADITFKFEQGSYNYDVTNFGSGDQLHFDAGASLSIINLAADGKVIVKAADAASSTTVSVTVSGISTAIDSTLLSVENFTNAFGANSLIAGDVTTTTPTTTTTGTPSTVAVSGAGSEDASAGDVTFEITQGNYTYTIDNYAAGDVLDFLDGTALSVQNSDGSDGLLTLLSADNATSSVTTIELTGVAAADDGSVFSVDSFNSTFGAGSII